jgi:uncharacterized protein YeaO (DUF488 family)
MITIKRIYEDYDPHDGYRILVDRLWPRGVKKETAHIDQWMKDIAPSPDLRKWFNHEPEKWSVFSHKYQDELNHNKAALEEIRKCAKQQEKITLLYGAKDTEHSHALVLQEYLKKHHIK